MKLVPIGASVWFVGFEGQKRAYLQRHEVKQLPVAATMLFGGISGTVAWRSTYKKVGKEHPLTDT